MSRLDAQELVEVAMSKIRPDDITHRGFLKPTQISLKTFQSQMMDPDCKIKPDSLPCGLKIAVRARDSDKRDLVDVKQIDIEDPFSSLEENSQNNMLSLIKKAEGIELAICVCMYSEDKKMLKSTIAGISENIANIVAYENINPDKIGVFVMMDGIEKVDLSIIDYFQQLEKSSNIYLGQNIVPSLSVAEMAKRAQTMTQEQINEEEMKNINNFLFDAAELDIRNNMRFESVRREYFERKDLLMQIKKLQKRRIVYEDLPNRLQGFFIDEARNQRKIDFAETDEQVKQIQIQQLIGDYASDINKMRPLIDKTLQKGENFCKEYIQSRQDLAYLSYFRKKVQFQPKHFSQEERERRYRQQFQETQAQIMQNQQSSQVSTVMNLFLCVKYKNAGKLSSHNWFFNGFCKELKPRYAVLLDVGLRPEGEALLKMYRYMKSDQNIGGVCGYMSLKMEKIDDSEQVKDEQLDFISSTFMKLTDIQRTQQVEYHFAHLMDKPFEAAFGFIHVLPGAYSAYNMKAIFDYDSEEDDKLLKSYFKSIDQKLASRKIVKSQMGVSNAILRTALPDLINSCCINIDPESDEAMLYNENVYLAEDRILCMGIHTRGYTMAFLPDAYAEVDPVKTVHGLLGQRKRWINGSYFAFEKVKRELSEHEKEIGCEIGLNMQIFYLSFMNSLAYFSPSFFLFTVHIAMQAFRQGVLEKYLATTVSPEVLNFFTLTMDFVYVMLVMTIIFYSLHLNNNHKRFKPYIYGVSTLMGIFMTIVFVVLFVDIIRGLVSGTEFLGSANNSTIPIQTINILRWVLVASILIYVVPIFFYILLFGNGHVFCQVLLGAFSFLFYTPTYLNMLNIYSLCRIDDISWGTKGLDSGSDKNANLKDSWRLIKFVHVAKYVIWNIILSAFLLTLGASYAPRFYVTVIMIIIIGVSMSLKITVAVIYMFIYKCKSWGGNQQARPVSESTIKDTIEKYDKQIRDDIKNNLNSMKEQYMSNHVGSFIQASRTKKNVEKAMIKQFNLSNIQKRNVKSFLSKGPLPMIKEEAYQNNRFDKKLSKDKFKNKPKVTAQLPEVKPPRRQITQNTSGYSEDKGSEKDLIEPKGHPKKQSSSPQRKIPTATSQQNMIAEEPEFKKREKSADKNRFKNLKK